jgi:nicotinamidase/pyrazinamidase
LLALLRATTATATRRARKKLREGTERLLVCGQALSHCVNYTVRDIVDNWPPDETGKITVLRDCASSVPGFEGAGEAFLEEMERAGVIVGTSDALW